MCCCQRVSRSFPMPRSVDFCAGTIDRPAGKDTFSNKCCICTMTGTPYLCWLKWYKRNAMWIMHKLFWWFWRSVPCTKKRHRFIEILSIPATCPKINMIFGNTEKSYFPSRHVGATMLQSVQSIFLLSVLQNILEFSMLLPLSLRQKQGDFRE